MNVQLTHLPIAHIAGRVLRQAQNIHHSDLKLFDSFESVSSYDFVFSSCGGSFYYKIKLMKQDIKISMVPTIKKARHPKLLR